MAQSIPDITVTPTWQSVNTLTSIAVGTEFLIQNKSPSYGILVWEGTQPTADSTDGALIAPKFYPGDVKIAPSGSLEIWVRSSTGKDIIAHVQQL